MVSNLLIISIAVLLIIGVIVYFYIQLTASDTKDVHFSDIPLILQVFLLAYPVGIIGFIGVITIIVLIANNMFKSNNSSMYRSTNINIRNRNKYV